MTHKQVIVVRKDLNMRKGKIGAQVAHASMKAILDNCKKDLSDNLIFKMDDRSKPWLSGNFKKICVYVKSERELLELYSKVTEDPSILHGLILDSGLTEFGGVPTYTCLAIGPDKNEVVDKYTKDLPLL